MLKFLFFILVFRFSHLPFANCCTNTHRTRTYSMINSHGEPGLTLLLFIFMDDALMTLIFALTMGFPY